VTERKDRENCPSIFTLSTGPRIFSMAILLTLPTGRNWNWERTHYEPVLLMDIGWRPAY
jgi:hypothetical protein